VSGEPVSDNTQKAVGIERGKLSPRAIVAIMALVAFFVPYAMQAAITRGTHTSFYTQ
jgi:hypothetical protein